MEMIKEFLEDELPFYIKRITKKYYIIRRSELGAGFFSNYLWVLGHVVFAQKLGYIPVVDMENYPTLYSEDVPVKGIYNAWNYYFENIEEASLEEAYQSKKYVLARIKYLKKYSDCFCQGIYRLPSKKTIDFYTPYINKYMKIREDILEELNNKFRLVYKENTKILGVHIRGTDMKNNLGHPIPAPTEHYLMKAKQLLNFDSAYQSIYLASDEIDVIEQFQQEFENSKIQLIFQDAFRVRDTEQKKKSGLHEIVPNHVRELHKYRMGLEVLEDAFFLSKCDSLICGHSNITNVAIIWNNAKYEKMMVLDNEE